jgi:hypothetical protein
MWCEQGDDGGCVCLTVCKEKGAGAKRLKTECSGSVSGVPWQTASVAAAKAAVFRKNRTTVGRKLANFLKKFK